MGIGSACGVAIAFIVLSTLSQFAGALQGDEFRGGIQNRQNRPENRPIRQDSGPVESRHPVDHHTGSSTSTVVTNTSVSSVSMIGNGSQGNPSTHAETHIGNNTVHVDTDRKSLAPTLPSDRDHEGSRLSSFLDSGKPSTSSAPSNSRHQAEPDRLPRPSQAGPDSSNTQHSGPKDHQGSRPLSPSPGANPQEKSPPGDRMQSQSSPFGASNAKPSSTRQIPDNHNESLPLSSLSTPSSVSTMPPAVQTTDNQTKASPSVVKPAGDSSRNATVSDPSAAVPVAKTASAGSKPASNATSSSPGVVIPPEGRKTTTTTVTKKKRVGNGSTAAPGSSLTSSTASYLAPQPSRGSTPMYTPPKRSPTNGNPPGGQRALYASPPRSPTRKSTPPLYAAKSPSSKTSTAYNSKPRSPSPALYSVSKRAPAPVYSSQKKSTKSQKAKKADSYKTAEKPKDSSSADARCRGTATVLAFLLMLGLLI